MKKIILSLSLMASVLSTSIGQVRTPSASTNSKIEQQVGLGNVTIEYSRPGVKGRKIYGDLVPFGQLWRTAANQGTKITFSDDVKIDGKEVKKGKYSLFTIPGASQWQIILHKDATLGVPNPETYKIADEAVRVAATPTKMADLKETFTVEFDKINDAGAEIFIAWENTRVAFTVDAITDAKVMANINQVMAGPSAGDYLAAANYYTGAGKDMTKAVEWAKKAVDMGANQFFQLRQYSLILAKAGKTADAIAAAKESLTKSIAAKNNDYIKMNEASIKEWSAKK